MSAASKACQQTAAAQHGEGFALAFQIRPRMLSLVCHAAPEVEKKKAEEKKTATTASD